MQNARTETQFNIFTEIVKKEEEWEKGIEYNYYRSYVIFLSRAISFFFHGACVIHCKRISILYKSMS